VVRSNLARVCNSMPKPYVSNNTIQKFNTIDYENCKLSFIFEAIKQFSDRRLPYNTWQLYIFPIDTSRIPLKCSKITSTTKQNFFFKSTFTLSSRELPKWQWLQLSWLEELFCDGPFYKRWRMMIESAFGFMTLLLKKGAATSVT
jgi:hypothetical protein